MNIPRFLWGGMDTCDVGEYIPVFYGVVWVHLELFFWGNVGGKSIGFSVFLVSGWGKVAGCKWL